MTSSGFLSRLNFLIATLALCAAPAIVRWLQDFATWSGFFSDVFCALLIAVLAMHLNRPLRALILLVWMLAQLGSFMLLASMARLPSWQDMEFVGDGTFVANSLSQVSESLQQIRNVGGLRHSPHQVRSGKLLQRRTHHLVGRM